VLAHPKSMEEQQWRVLVAVSITIDVDVLVSTRAKIDDKQVVIVQWQHHFTIRKC
jgi:hypothetical protein